MTTQSIRYQIHPFNIFVPQVLVLSTKTHSSSGLNVDSLIAPLTFLQGICSLDLSCLYYQFILPLDTGLKLTQIVFVCHQVFANFISVLCTVSSSEVGLCEGNVSKESQKALLCVFQTGHDHYGSLIYTK